MKKPMKSLIHGKRGKSRVGCEMRELQQQEKEEEEEKVEVGKSQGCCCLCR